jgi:hypothetical protein
MKSFTKDKQNEFSEIAGSHGSKYEDDSLPRFCTVSKKLTDI